MENDSSVKAVIYLVSMGSSPDRVKEFIRAFSQKYNIPQKRVVEFSQRLPVSLGEHDLEKAQKIGIEIKRMGGDVKLKRKAVEPTEKKTPITPSTKNEDDSFVVSHGAAESQEELRNLTKTAPGVVNAASPVTYDNVPPTSPPGSPYDYPASSAGEMPPFEPPEERKIGGKFAVKHSYTAEEAYGMGKEEFNKIKGLYAERKEKTDFFRSPIVKLIALLLILVGGFFAYRNKDFLLSSIFSKEMKNLSEAYVSKINSEIPLPNTLTGKYVGTLTSVGRYAKSYVTSVEMNVKGKEIKSLSVLTSFVKDGKTISSTSVVYTTGSFSYERKSEGTLSYKTEKYLFGNNKNIGTIDGRGFFHISIKPETIGISPAEVPETEKDKEGNVVFLDMEGIYGDVGTFYGGLRASTIPIIEWEAMMQ